MCIFAVAAVVCLLLFRMHYGTEGVCDGGLSLQTPLCQPRLWSKLLPEVQVYMCVR